MNMAVGGKYKKVGTHNRDDIRGSDEARSINRGLKQKEVDDSILNGGLVLSIIVSVIVGMNTHWIVGAILFFVVFCILGYWYYKE
jgi:hypothetical protein